MKKIILSTLVVFMTTSTIFAGNWIQNGTDWQYMDNNEYVIGQQKKIDGNYYYFDYEGFLLTGYQEIDNKFYVFNNDGTPKTEPIVFAGKTYNVTNKGEIKNITKAEFESLVENSFITNTGALAGDLAYAQKLVDTLPISKNLLKEILTSKGITTDKIEYAINNVNVDWKNQAVKCANHIKTYSIFSKIDMKTILTANQFTDNEASFAADTVLSDAQVANRKPKYEVDGYIARYQVDMLDLAKNINP